jgi:chromosome segregation protein
MRLKKIRLAGFKSFVDPTNIPFPGDMTAVVGPNGCGKSNVIDAVRWVLGESSAKNLRGDAMTDVIFNGSSARKPVSQCSVELVFDNSSGRISGEYAKYNELSVKRLVTKDAISSYTLNGTKCRRRDITDLFLGTGLGPRSYAIIEQGMISKLIESKPQELRVFIEEAAGISKYKERRKETLNRISHTKDNLDRLEDVRQELGDQLAKLKRQATAANRYKELKQEERTLKAQLATLRWLAQSALLKQSDDIIREFEQDLADLMAGKLGDEAGLQTLKNDQSMAKQKLSELQQQNYHLGNEITKLEQSQLFAKKRASQIQAELVHLQQQNAEVSKSLMGVDEDLAKLHSQINEGSPEKEMLEEQLHEVEDSQLHLQERQSSIQARYKQAEDSFYQQKQQVQQKHSQLQQTLSLQQRTEARIAELERELTEHSQNHDGHIQTLQDDISKLDAQLSHVSTVQETLAKQVALADEQQDDASEELKKLETSYITLQAQCDALEQLQLFENEDIPDFLQAAMIQAAWQQFTVQAGYEKVLEAALALYPQALVAKNLSATDVLAQDQMSAFPLMLESAFTTEKREHSLAKFVDNARVPHYFNQILVAKSLKQAQLMLTDLAPSDWIITQTGETLASDVFVSNVQQTESKVLRKVKITALTSELAALDVSLQEAKHIAQQKAQSCAVIQAQKAHADQQLNDLQNQKALLERDLFNAQSVRQQQVQREQKIRDEITRQTETLAQEEMTLELLTEEIEQASIDLSELEGQKFELEADRDGIQIQLQSVQSQLQQIQQRLHSQVLLNQSLQNSYQILQEQQKNKHTQIVDNEDKAQLLKDEAETLAMPGEQQYEKLQEMLHEQRLLAEQQQTLQMQLDELEESVLMMEKGQLGVNEKIDGIKQQIESERLHAQTAKVKAQTFIEQLAQMQQNVKEVLAALPEDAD